MAEGYSFGEYTPTWDEVLSMATEEELYEALGVPLDEKIFVSPFRADNNPTCTMWMSPKGHLYFRDWAVGDAMSVFKLTEYVYQCTEEQALRILYQMAKGITSLPKEERMQAVKPKLVHKPCEIRVRRRPWEKEDFEWWSKFGITASTLKFYRVDPLERAWFNDNQVFESPYGGLGYVYDFMDHDYKLYFPDKTKYRFLHNRADLLQGYDQLPLDGDLLIATKSMKDVMTLREMGFSSIAPMSESTPIRPIIMEELKKRFNHVLILYDNDVAGVENAVRMSTLYEVPYVYLPKDWAKDISDLVRSYGGAKKGLNFIKDAVSRIFDR